MITTNRLLDSCKYICCIIFIMCCCGNCAILSGDVTEKEINAHNQGNQVKCLTSIITTAQLQKRRPWLESLDPTRFSNRSRLLLDIKDMFNLKSCSNFLFVMIYKRSRTSSITIWYKRKILVTLEPINQSYVVMNVIDEECMDKKPLSDIMYPTPETISTSNEVIITTTVQTLPETTDENSSSLPIIVGVTVCVGILILFFAVYSIWRRKKTNVKSLDKATVGYDRQIDVKKVNLETMSKAIAHELTKSWEDGVAESGSHQQGTLNEGYQEENVPNDQLNPQGTLTHRDESGDHRDTSTQRGENVYIIDESGGAETENIYSHIKIDTDKGTTHIIQNHKSNQLDKGFSTGTDYLSNESFDNNIYEDVSVNTKANEQVNEKASKNICVDKGQLNSGFLDEELYTVPVLNEMEESLPEAAVQEYHYVQMDKRGSYSFDDEHTASVRFTQFVSSHPVDPKNPEDAIMNDHIDHEGYTVSNTTNKRGSIDIVDDNQSVRVNNKAVNITENPFNDDELYITPLTDKVKTDGNQEATSNGYDFSKIDSVEYNYIASPVDLRKEVILESKQKSKTLSNNNVDSSTDDENFAYVKMT